ncbi:N-acetyl sugar amidotransferase [bacterium]|nr:MAG: N-acetyl sugar amidotransferase [bacterium]
MNDQKNTTPFQDLQYCIRCCIPETQEGVDFDEMGICQACRSSEEKMHINWAEREKDLRAILDDAKAKSGDNYDCIIPISGGKDSTFQLHVLTKVYGMKPLAVTFSHNWFSGTGMYNLLNSLEKFNVDHIMFTPNRNLVNRTARRSLEAIGDACWHCHAGVGAFPLQVAVAYKIPLLIWGESISESSGRASYKCKRLQFDKDYFLAVSAKRKPEEMVCDYLTMKDLAPFKNPTPEECLKVGVHGIHLGDYIFWDDERQMEFVRDNYAWKETNIDGTYKRYKSAECIMPGVHDFTCYLKRGYGRGTFHASVDVRAGLLTREEGFELAKKHDSMRPDALDYYLKITGLTEDEFHKIMEGHRLKKLGKIAMPINFKSKEQRKSVKPFVEELIEKTNKENL